MNYNLEKKGFYINMTSVFINWTSIRTKILFEA